MGRKQEFIAFMQQFDIDDLPDGAWLRNLELAGEQWLEKHPERGIDGNDMAHKYLQYTGEFPDDID